MVKDQWNTSRHPVVFLCSFLSSIGSYLLDDVQLNPHEDDRLQHSHRAGFVLHSCSLLYSDSFQ